MWLEDSQNAYFDLLAQYKDRIVIELAGHDHFASLRAHQNDDGELYHNLFVSPSITPWYNNNPGVSSFEISEELIPSKLKTTFLNLAPTIGLDKRLPQGELEFRYLDYEEKFAI